MSRSIAYLTSHANFVQVSEEIPVTKQRNPDKVDPPDVFEGESYPSSPTFVPLLTHGARKKRTKRNWWMTSW